LTTLAQVLLVSSKRFARRGGEKKSEWVGAKK